MKEIKFCTGVEPELLHVLLLLFLSDCWNDGSSSQSVPEAFFSLLRLLSLDALPLSYRRLVGAKAIKLGSCDKHPAYC